MAKKSLVEQLDEITTSQVSKKEKDLVVLIGTRMREGLFEVIEIEYDANNGEVESSKTHVCSDKNDMYTRFKIVAVESGNVE